MTVGAHMTRISQLNAAATIVCSPVLCLAWPVPVLAQDNKRPADANRGAVIAAQGAAGAPACAACQAFDGTFDTLVHSPELTANPRPSFRKKSPDMMAPIAKQLDDQEIAAVAAY
jgi:cytochrome c553